MKDEMKKRVVYMSVLFVMSFFALAFVTVMGYLNYRTNAIELEEQAMARVEADAVARLETALEFGKSFENFYGIDVILDSFTEQISAPAPFITDRDGKLLYSKDAKSSLVSEAISSDRFVKELSAAGETRSGKFKQGNLRVVFTDIRYEDEVIGFFCCAYTEDYYRSGFSSLKARLFHLLILSVLIIFIALFIYVFIVSDHLGKLVGDGLKTLRESVIPMFIMTIGIIILSVASIAVFQKDYRYRIDAVTRISLSNLESTIRKVRDQGVDLRSISELDEYIRAQVASLETLSSVRVTERIAEVDRTDEASDIISFIFNSGGKAGDVLYLEAEISNDAMRTQIRNMVLILLSTTIILLIFVFELGNIVELIVDRSGVRTGDQVFSEKQIGLSLRLTGFLCSTAEYMCIPYAAMLIRDSGQSLFGLSVGMTAALPLTVEGFTQMAAVALLPRFVRKYNVKVTLVLSGVLMILCNLTAFFMNAALFIVICRGIAGIAYGGFKQVSNHMITRGYTTESGRSANISQDNAGLLAGATCGAGLGAILSANAGYSITFMCSAMLTAAYLLVTFLTVPWKALTQDKAESSEKKGVSFGDIKKMLTSPELLMFLLFICLPLNIGVMLCVTLIPAVCQMNDISSVMLSYCYIGNGLAGIYIGPALVSRARKRFGAIPCIMFTFILTGAGIILLKIPPVIVMIVIASVILGFLDGFGTPLVTDSFMDLKVVRESVDESTALVFSVVVFSVLLTIAPVIAELMLIPGEGVFSPMLIGAYIYIAAAVIVFLIYRRKIVNRKNIE